MTGRVVRFVVPVAFIVVGLSGYRWLLGTPPETPELEVIEREWSVRTMTIHPRERAAFLSLLGRIESPRHVPLSAAVHAEVNDVLTAEGSMVEAGMTVVVLDPRDAQLALQQREAEVKEIRARIGLEVERARQERESLVKERSLLGLARKDLARAQDLAKRGIATELQLEKAQERVTRQDLAVIARDSSSRAHENRLARLEAQLTHAETARDLAALDVNRTEVTAPFRGRVTEVFVAKGVRVRPGERLLSIYDVSRLQVRAQIANRHRAEVEQRSGKAGYFDLDGRRHQVTLDGLGGQVLAGRGGIDAVFRIEDAPENLRIGRTVKLEFDLTPRPAAVWLPFEALHGTDKVYKVLDGRLAAVRVRRVGEARNAGGRVGVLVTSRNLESGDQLVVSQLANAMEGLRVVSIPGEDPE